MRFASLTLVLALAACHRAPGPTTTPTNKADSQAAELLAKDPLAFLPRDSEVVVDVDLAKLKASPLWQSQIEPKMTAIVGARLASLRDMCGIDYVQTTSRFTAGIKKTGKQVTGVMVVRGPDAAATMSCIETKGAQSAKVTRDGDALVVVPAPDVQTSTAVTSVGPTTLVVAIEVGATRATVTDAIAAGTPLRSSSTFMALHDAVDPSASIVAIANGASSMFEPMRSFGVAPTWAVVTATIEASYVVAARLVMADEAGAARIAEMIKSNAGAVKAMVERFEVSSEKELVRVDVTVTEAQAKMILGLLGL